MIDSIKKAFAAYKSKPLLFMWGSFVYLFMFLLFLLAAFGLALIYFMLASIVRYEVTLESPVTLGILLIISVVFIYFTGGVNASLAKTYYSAVSGVKTSLLDFYHYALSRAPQMFGVVLMREFITLLLIGPVAAIYYYFLTETQYMDYLLYLYVFFVIFVLHLVFTPALISVALGSLPFDAFRSMLFTLKKKHIYYVGLFLLFAMVWVLNFIPLVQLVTIFFLYPVIYTALIIFVKEGGQETFAETKPKASR